jgi:hypothetical protein
MSAPWASAVRLSFGLVSPENTTEPSAVSKRYARAGMAWPWVTATAVTRSAASLTTRTGVWGVPSGQAGTAMSMPRTSAPGSGMRASSGMTFRW